MFYINSLYIGDSAGKKLGFSKIHTFSGWIHCLNSYTLECLSISAVMPVEASSYNLELSSLPTERHRI